MPHIITSRLAGSKRKYPFIDTEELPSRPGDAYAGLKSDEALPEFRRRNIGEWAHSYLRGEPLFLETAVLKGPFETNAFNVQQKQTRLGVETVPNSQEDLELQQQFAITITSQENSIPISRQTDELAAPIARFQILNEILPSIEENDIHGTKPVAYVRGKPIFQQTVINSHGVPTKITRDVETWPHDLRAENQMERWERTRREYIQNTPWNRKKVIPSFNPTEVLEAQTNIQRQSSIALVIPQQRSKCTSIASRDHSIDATPALSDHNDRSAEDTGPTTPVRQIITVDTQLMELIGQSDMQMHTESCQTAELLDDSQINPGDVHTRLQQVLKSSPPFVSTIDDRAEAHFEAIHRQGISYASGTAPPLPTLVSCSRPTESTDHQVDQHSQREGIDSEPLIKLKELEEAIDQQLLTATDHVQKHDSNILVSSSLEGLSEELIPPESSDQTSEVPESSTSTDRVESSQPEERTAVIVGQIAPKPVLHPRIEKAPRQVSFEQSSIRKAFQVNKSFETKSRSPEKLVIIPSNQTKPPELSPVVARVVTSDLATNRSDVGASQQTSLRASRKGTLKYGKRKAQPSLFSSSRNDSFLQKLPISQRELQRATVESHGYNYDVDDDFDLDGTINELGSFLSSWDREIGA